jgi:1,4-alpha-glucan branching enzyme
LRENRYFVERIGGAVTGRENWYARAQARLGWALNVAMPCTPLLFMGGECHHYGYWNPTNDPYGDHRFDWSIAGDTIGWEMRTLVSDINALRWNHPALRSDLPPLFPHRDLQNHVLAFLRLHPNGEKILAVVNLGDQQWNEPVYGVHLAGMDNAWSEIFNSQAPQYGGWPNSGNGSATLYVGGDGLLSIRLPQWSVLLFRNNQ